MAMATTKAEGVHSHHFHSLITLELDWTKKVAVQYNLSYLLFRENPSQLYISWTMRRIFFFFCLSYYKTSLWNLPKGDSGGCGSESSKTIWAQILQNEYPFLSSTLQFNTIVSAWKKNAKKLLHQCILMMDFGVTMWSCPSWWSR